MIKALVLDIDGVLVGERVGFNSPYPNPDVIKRLSVIRASGIPVVLCTAKPHYSIRPIIDNAKLTNAHIVFAGGIIIDPLKNAIVESHPIPKGTSSEILKKLLANSFYLELYTQNEYYVLSAQRNKLTDVHTHILQQAPVFVDSFETIVDTEDIYKILPIVPDESGIGKVNEVLKPFEGNIEVTWSIHPIANPHQFCNIAPTGVSKRQATLNVLSHLGISPGETLAVGDSTSDWKFMEITGFAATLENGQEPLKQHVATLGSKGFIGGHVDANGILPIFDHFNLPASDTHP